MREHNWKRMDSVDGTISSKHYTPDTGWAWVIAFAGMFNMFIGVGLYRSLGMLMVKLTEVFEAPAAKFSLIFTSVAAGYCTCAILYVFGIGQIFHERALVLVSGLIGSVGFFLTYFYTELEGFYVSAFCVGAMEQVSMSSSLGIVGKYFNKRLSIGNGIAMSGVSLGTLALPTVVQLLYDEYTYRGAGIIIAGFILNTFVCAALMRPARVSQSSITQETYIQEQQKSNDTHEEHPTYTIRQGDNSESGLTGVVGVKVKDTTTPILRCSRMDTFSKYLVAKDDVGETSDATNGHIEIEYRATEVPTSSNALKALKQFVFVNVGDKPKSASRLQTVFGGLVFFKTASFSFYQLFAFLSTFGCEGLIQFFPAFLADSGTPHYRIALLLSIIGGSDFVARILLGCLGDYVNRDVLVLVPQLVLALTCFLAKFATETWSQIILALSIGLTYGTTYSFMGVILIDYFGLEHLSQLLGITNCVGSLGFTVGSPLMGYLRDVTGSYQTSLQILGVVFLSSFASFGLVVIIKLCGRLKKKSDDLS